MRIHEGPVLWGDVVRCLLPRGTHMAELVGVTSTDGIPRVINVDHVVQVWDMPHNECRIQLNGETVTARMTAIEFAQLGRTTIGGRSP
jgi:hypothetical protein